jgi:anti-sigma B factor antagonist
MDFSLTRHMADDGVFILGVIGEVDAVTGSKLAAAIHDAIIAENAATVVVDLAGVTFLDSTGISVLVMGSHLAAKCGAAFMVVGARDNVRVVLEVTGVWNALTRPAPPIPGRVERQP